MASLIERNGTKFKVIEYIDTKNDSGILNEMLSHIQRYLRDNFDIKITKDELKVGDNERFFVKIDEDNFVVELFEKVKYGMLWTNIENKNLIRLECHKCKRIVPKTFKVKGKYEKFCDELRDAVLKVSSKDKKEKNKKKIIINIDFNKRKEMLENLMKKNKI